MDRGFVAIISFPQKAVGPRFDPSLTSACTTTSRSRPFTSGLEHGEGLGEEEVVGGGRPANQIRVNVIVITHV